MTTGEIQTALNEFNESAGVGQDSGDQIRFEPVAETLLADSSANSPEPQGSSLDIDALKKTASEREQAEDLLRAVRRRDSVGGAELNADAAAQPQSGEQSRGVAVRVYPNSPAGRDAPGPGAKVQIIDELTKKVTLTQG